VKKHITVYTNDPGRPTIPLTIYGQVEKFARIEPSLAVLRGTAGHPIRQWIRIIPDEKHPFHIKRSEATQGTYIQYRLEETDDQGKKSFKLKIENLRNSKGMYEDTIILYTDSKLRPEISIPVRGIIN
jgi:hypothetical protein